MTATVVGGINTLGAVIAYSFLLPEDRGISQAPLIERGPTVTEYTPLPSAPSTPSQGGGSTTQPTQPAQNQQLRKPNEPLKIGQAPQPSAIVTDNNGQQVYQWCSGVNPDLEDGVCKAILSLAANPSESNPHLGQKARESLSLLPRDVVLVMDESSWKKTSATSGSMLVTAKTKDYGDVKLKIFMEKKNNIWILNDGQLA